MLWWIMNEWPDRHNWEIIVVFANTGKEVEGTLFFVDECAQEWNIPIVWVEGYSSAEGAGWSVDLKIVDYKTAARKGEPFEAMIKRLGIPSSEVPFCSEVLKRRTILAYARSIEWTGFYTAIGVRWDEQHRVNDNWISNRLWYPLVFDNPTLKRDIIIWWGKQSFDLDIHPDDGNCDNCWKKDTPRLVRNYIRKPKSFDWWENMTTEYGHHNPRNVDLEPPFNFFRGNMSVMDIRELANLSQAELKQLSMFDPADGCAESCEVF